MSRFYGTITAGGDGPGGSRQGTTKTGLIGHTRGWDVGAEVWARNHPEGGHDVIEVAMTGGSNAAGGCYSMGLLTIEEGPDGPMVTGVSDYLRQRVEELS